jgi:hypothetical protein
LTATEAISERVGDLLVEEEVEDFRLEIIKGDPGMCQQVGDAHKMLVADQDREIGFTVKVVVAMEGHTGAQRGSPAIFGSRGIVTGVKIACICMHIPLHRMLR